MRLRVILVPLVIVLAAAAPARAWCEASCAAPRHDTPSHCPSPSPADDAASVAAAGATDCPVLESARTTSPARLDIGALETVHHLPRVKSNALRPPAFARRHAATTVFERSTPLRI